MGKTLFILLLLVLAATACQKQESAFYPKHLIKSYSEGTYELCYDDLFISVELENKGRRIYNSPDAVLPADERYLEIARRNGDTCFYQPTYSLWYMDRGAWADNLCSLSITSNADWDESHPVGKPLNDLLEFRALTFGPYISSGYDSQVSQAIYLYAPLPELTEEELSILSAYEWDWPSFYFVKSPDQTEEHKITVRIEADYGEPVRTASIRCIPVWRH